MTIVRSITAAALLASGIVIAAPASALVTTFATFSAPTGADNFAFVNSGNSNARTTDATFYSTNNSVIKTSTSHGVTTSTVKSYGTPGAVDVRFSFLQSAFTTQPVVQNVDALLTVTGTIAKNTPLQTATVFGQTVFDQANFSGTFTFVTKTAITVGAPNFMPHTYAAGSNLLTVTFNGADITGSIGGSSGNSQDSTLGGGTVTFTSDFLDFTQTSERDLALSLTSVFPTFAQASMVATKNQALKSFLTNGSGQFSSDPAPVINGLVVVPEPGVWMLMVAGFGLVGVSARRRVRSITA